MLKQALTIGPFCMLAGCTTLASKELVVGCQGADATTTIHATGMGARERNPVVAALLNAFGPTGFVVAKVSATLILLHVHPDVPRGLMALANGVTCGAAVNNAKVISDLHKKSKPAQQPPGDKHDVEDAGRGGEI